MKGTMSGDHDAVIESKMNGHAHVVSEVCTISLFVPENYSFEVGEPSIRPPSERRVLLRNPDDTETAYKSTCIGENHCNGNLR